MKRIISLMLVAMLLVGALSTVAFAAGEVRTETIDVVISGADFSSFGGRISVSDPAKITGISGATGSPSGKVGYANFENKNVSSVTVSVTVEVPADYCGSVSASFTQEEAKQVQFNDDGTAVTGYVDVSLSGSGSTSFDHVCAADWKSNDTHHWHECEVCGVKCDEAEHKFENWKTIKEATETEGGVEEATCVCGRKTTRDTDPKPTEPTEPQPTEPQPTEPQPTEPQPTEPQPTEPSDDGKDEVADTGDITPYGLFNTMIAVVVLAMVSAVVLAFKRKTAK